MTFDEAKIALAGDIQEDGHLYNLGHYMYWRKGDTMITLDCEFSIDELEAIVVYVKEMNDK